MKRIRLIGLLLLLPFVAKAQYSMVEPRPSWVYDRPIAPAASNYIFVTGVGIGANEAEALERASSDALIKALKTLGLFGVQGQAGVIGQLRNVSEIKAVLQMHKLQQVEACASLPITLKNAPSKSNTKVYVLYQVQQSAAQRARFHERPRDFSCEDQQFLEAYERWHREFKDAQEAEEKARERAETWRSVKETTGDVASGIVSGVGSLVLGGPSYACLGIAGYTHPRSLSGKIVLRSGGFLGFGIKAGVGWMQSSVSKEDESRYIENDADEEDHSLLWNGGGRFYFARRLFIGVGYGVNENTYSYTSKDNKTYIKWEKHYGMQYTVGLDLVTLNDFFMCLL